MTDLRTLAPDAIRDAPQSLAEVRRRIDAIDDQLLTLLQKRFDLIADVRRLKQADAAAIETPLRPAREAQVLRRLLAKSGSVPQHLLVRLWPAIFCAASLRQAPVSIHTSADVAGSAELAACINAYFPLMPLNACNSAMEALVSAGAAPADIAVVATAGDWLAHYLDGKAFEARVIAALPLAAPPGQPAAPRLLVLGHAPTEATGRDETLVVCNGGFPRDFPLKINWQVQSAGHHIAGLAGYLAERESPLVGLIRSNPRLGLRILGRYPAPLTLDGQA